MRLLAAICAAAALAAPCFGQSDGRILLIDRPTGPRAANIDLTDYVSRDLSAAGGYQPVIYKPSLQAVKEAVASNALAAADLTEPLSVESARKIAKALGFRQILLLSGQSTPSGVAGNAEMERMTGQQTWSSVFVFKLEPYRGKSGKPSLIEGIKAQVALIVQKVTGKASQIITQDPIAVKVEPKEPGPAPKTPDKSDTDSATPPKVEPGAPQAPNPPARPAYELQADRYRREGDHPNLILSLRKAVNEKPREAGLRRQLIQAYMDRGLHDSARSEAARAAVLIPEDAGIRRILGEAYLKSGDPDSALRELTAAVKANPKDVLALVAIGDVHFASARSPEAEKAFIEAAAADSAHPLPHRRLARLYADRGQYSDALKSLTIVRGAVKDAEADSLVPDYAAILGVLDSGLTEVLTRVQMNRQAVIDGTRNREQAFTFGVTQRKRAEEISAFLDSMPTIPALSKVQNLYGQAAGFVIQACEASLLHVENQDTKRDEEASLLRLEATRALSDASKRLKDVSSKPPA